jgi:polar amino acid transport system substrate-binding protein
VSLHCYSHRFLLVLAFCCFLFSGASTSLSQVDTQANARKIIVAIKPAPPFVMKTEDGRWSGLAIDFLEEVARELQIGFSLTDAETTDGLIEAVANGRAQAGIAAVTITPEREKAVDFTHSYYKSGLAIAVSGQRNSGIFDTLRALTSPPFLATVGMLVLLLLAMGALIWLVESRHNSDQFQKSPLHGIGSGFWWSAVTMTTVGYGDKTPVTPLGRAIGVVWMFAALILTAVFTAHLTSSLTVDRIAGPVSSVADLPRARVGVVGNSASNAYFERHSIRTHAFEDSLSGLEALAANQIDAFVHDEPILRYQIIENYPGRLRLLAQVFEPQDYGIVLPSGSPWREQVNQALLKVRDSDRWSEIRRQYLGEVK